MTTIILISLGAIALAGATVLIVRALKKRSSDKERSEVKKHLENALKDSYDDSASKLVSQFKWYFTYNPDLPEDKQTPYNRQQRRRIEKHYKKFLFDWWEIPKGCRSIPDIVQYLVQKDWKTNVVGRYVDEYIKGKHEEGYEKRKEELKKIEEKAREKAAEEKRRELMQKEESDV